MHKQGAIITVVTLTSLCCLLLMINGSGHSSHALGCVICGVTHMKSHHHQARPGQSVGGREFSSSGLLPVLGRPCNGHYQQGAAVERIRSQQTFGPHGLHAACSSVWFQSAALQTLKAAANANCYTVLYYTKQISSYRYRLRSNT